jgi:hypothetical protein
MLETGASGSVGGKGGNILVYPATSRPRASARQPASVILTPDGLPAALEGHRERNRGRARARSQPHAKGTRRSGLSGGVPQWGNEALRREDNQADRGPGADDK